MVENPHKIQLLDNVMDCFWHPYMASSNSTRHFNNFNATETGTSSGNVSLLALE